MCFAGSFTSLMPIVQTTMENFLLFTYVVAIGIQIGFWCFLFSRFARFLTTDTAFAPSATLPEVSVIVCARNEASNLRQHLPQILAQQYAPNWELVVVNDASDDATAIVLTDFQRQYPDRLRIVTITEKTQAGKKAALATGIAAARHEWLLLTDADCAPVSADWLALMAQASQTNEATALVLGFSPYLEMREGSRWLNHFVRLEAVWTAVQYVSFALIGLPYMGVGRNMMYRKTSYQNVNGFDRHRDLSSGDDDLLVNALATHKNFSIILKKNSWTVSAPKTTWKSYFRQKNRHFSTAKRYRWQHQVGLALLSGTHFWVYGIGAYLMVCQISTIFVALLFVLRMGLIFILYERILRRLQMLKLLWFVFLFDALLVLFYIIFSPSLINKTQNWK
jgi:poly-beta-1,6-N-acetyl-D-glucosamine synthase